MKRTFMMLAAAALIAFPSESQDAGVSALRLSLESASVSGGERVKGRVAISRTTGVPAQPVLVKLESSDATLVRFSTPDITIPATDSSALFDFSTAATPIRTSVSIRALIAPAKTVQAQAALELVPALIDRVTLNRTTMTGTRGSTVAVTAELKAAAPAGGIELYLSPPYLTPPVSKSGSLLASNPRVAAGSKAVTFTIPYEALVEIFSSFRYEERNVYSADFESQTRRVDVVVALDPQTKTPWDAIPNKAVKTGFDLVPLRIVSLTVQPSSINGSGEALATFSLNAPPGANERVMLGRSDSVVRVVLAGSSCQSTGLLSSSVEMTLAAGSTSQNFKVCGRPVTAATAREVSVTMRSGEYKAGVTIQP